LRYARGIFANIATRYTIFHSVLVVTKSIFRYSKANDPDEESAGRRRLTTALNELDLL